MKLHTSAHKHVGDAGKPGQIVNPLPDQRSIAHTARDLMYQHGVSPFNPTQKQAKT